LTFLITTPAAVIEPLHFWRFISDLVNIGYSDGWYGHTVRAGWPHAGWTLQWLGLAALSAFKALSLFWAALALVGAAALWRRSRRAFLVLLVFPVLYVVYMSTMWAMIVRNLLVVVPFVAILAALGAAAVYDKLPGGWARRGWAALLLGAVLVNAAWLVHAAETIAHRQDDQYVSRFVEWLGEHPDKTVALSERVRRLVANRLSPAWTHVMDDVEQADWFCVYHRELFPDIRWIPANDPFMAEACFGPLEVNMNYYPDWAGDDHLLVIRTSKLAELRRRGAELRGIMRARRELTGRPTEKI
jgi:hypothetical protein